MRLTYGLLITVVLTLAVQVFLRNASADSVTAWMTHFLWIMLIVGTLSAGVISLPRWRNWIIPFVAFFVSIASIPFGDEIGIRLSLLLYLGIIAATSRSIAMVSVIMSLHLVGVIAAMDVVTPFPDAPGQTSTATIVPLAAWAIFVSVLVGRDVTNHAKGEATRARVRHLEDTVSNLSQANIGYNDFARLARHQALLEERNRITREIHDDIGYTLTNITMLSEAVMSSIESGDSSVHDKIDAIKHQAQTGLYETRRVLRLLRETERKMPRGANALKELFDIYQRATGVLVDVDFLVSNSRLEDSSISLTIYHFVQECLTNAFRHGEATEVHVRFLESDNWLFVTVRDNGFGAPSVTEGIGLQGMKERIAHLGGHVAYHQDSGFVVTARIPLREKSEALRTPTE